MKSDVIITGKQKAQSSQYPCLCAVIRKAGRILTKRYDRYLKPCGLKITQSSMLANISQNQGITVTELANLLVMDQTTITRNLRVLDKSGFILLQSDASDQRVKRIQLTDAGLAKMAELRPLWEKAQRETEEVLGPEIIGNLLGSLDKIST